MKSSVALISMSALVIIAAIETVHAGNDETLNAMAITEFKKRKPDILKLRKAAATGDKESQFYLAEALRLSAGHMTSEAYSWYESSAEQGDIYSMYRLSRQNHDVCGILGNCPSKPALTIRWDSTLLKTAKERAQIDDGEALEMMYVLTGDLEWLAKSATLGHPSAQNWLAVRYERGDGWFILPSQRKREISRLYKASAEGGYPRAMSEYAGDLLTNGDIKGAQQWLMKGVSISYAPAVGAYAYNLEHGKYYHFKKDLILAYALYLLLAEIGGGVSDAAEYSLSKINGQLTPEQLNLATQKAKAWKIAHPPISYYPHKLESH